MDDVLGEQVEITRKTTMTNIANQPHKSNAKQPWLRLYRASLHSPKIVTLSDRQHRAWHNCLLIAGNDGRLPSTRDIAVHMRMTTTEAEQLICELVEAGLIDPEMNGSHTTYVMHDWLDHQPPSDSSTERVRKHRKSKDETPCNGDVTAMKRFSNVIESDTDTDTERKFLASEQVAARAKSDELRFDLNFKMGKGRGKADSLDRIAKRAEGLGLDVADMRATMARVKPKNPTAYLTTLCVNQLRGRLPGIDERLIRDALWGKDQPYASICQLLLMATP